MISVNFASRNYRLVARVQAALILAIVLLGVVTAGMIFSTVSLRRTASSMEAKLRELAAIDNDVQPLLKERGQLVDDLSRMTGLVDSKRFSWTRLLTSIEGVVPLGIALKEVDYNPRDHTLVLEGMAQSPEALRNLIVGLEKSPSFRDPLLKHQSIEKGSRSNSFNVVAVYTETAGSAAARGK